VPHFLPGNWDSARLYGRTDSLVSPRHFPFTLHSSSLSAPHTAMSIQHTVSMRGASSERHSSALG
jgi:hypothetical protein